MLRGRTAALLPGLLAALWTSCAGTGCAQQDGIRGSGHAAERTFTLPSFHAVRTEGGLALDITVGVPGPAVLETDDNLLDLIDVHVADGVLDIRPRESISPQVGVHFSASTERLDEVTMVGAASVTLAGLESPSLRLSLTGAANARASGRVEHLELICRGAASVDLSDLEAQTAVVRAEGAASIRVRTSGPLEVEASGAARVVQCGDGPIEERTSGLAVVTRASGDD